MASSGTEQSDFTGYARRRRMTTAMDGGSIPPISTIWAGVARCRDPWNHVQAGSVESRGRRGLGRFRLGPLLVHAPTGRSPCPSAARSRRRAWPGTWSPSPECEDLSRIVRMSQFGGPRRALRIAVAWPSSGGSAGGRSPHQAEGLVLRGGETFRCISRRRPSAKPVSSRGELVLQRFAMAAVRVRQRVLWRGTGQHYGRSRPSVHRSPLGATGCHAQRRGRLDRRHDRTPQASSSTWERGAMLSTSPAW